MIREKYEQGEITITVPDLILYEISNALRYNKKINEEDVRNAVDSLIQLEIAIIVPISKVLHHAVTLAFKYNLTLYDSYFLALSDVLKFTFITADVKLFNKVKESFSVILLKDVKF